MQLLTTDQNTFIMSDPVHYNVVRYEKYDDVSLLCVFWVDSRYLFLISCGGPLVLGFYHFEGGNQVHALKTYSSTLSSRGITTNPLEISCQS